MLNKEKLAADLTAIREKSPLVHNITNYVAMNFTANALLAVGASPVMAHAVEEMEDMHYTEDDNENININNDEEGEENIEEYNEEFNNNENEEEIGEGEIKKNTIEEPIEEGEDQNDLNENDNNEKEY